MSRRQKTVQEIVDAVKITIGIGVVLLFLLLLGAVAAYSTPTHTFSNDHYTVANSTDGEQVVVTYEVNFEKHGDMSTADRKQAMDNMKLAQSCANERLDAWLQTHSKDEARGSNLAEITVECGNEHIGIERAVTADALTRNA